MDSYQFLSMHSPGLDGLFLTAAGVVNGLTIQLLLGFTITQRC